MKMEQDSEMMMMPVIISESNYDQHDNRRIDIAINNTSIEQRSRDIIKSAITNSEFTWQAATSGLMEAA